MFKKIFNFHEEATNLRLNEVCGNYGAKAYPKVRVADVLLIENSGISNTEYSYALKAHFDFVVCDKEHMPQFAVEFDGPSHNKKSQKEKDQLKNKLCDRFDFPLLRINSNHLPKKYREYDLLSWLAETWFLSIEFHQAQEAGHVPWDEPFDPMMFINLPGKRTKFPMWLASEVRIKVQKLAETGRIANGIISHWIGIDENNNYHGIAWLKVSDEVGVISETAMRKQQFPVSESELLSEILCFQVYEQLERVLKGENPGMVYQAVMNQVRKYSEIYKERSFAGYGNENPKEK